MLVCISFLIQVVIFPDLCYDEWFCYCILDILDSILWDSESHLIFFLVSSPAAEV